MLPRRSNPFGGPQPIWVDGTNSIIFGVSIMICRKTLLASGVAAAIFAVSTAGAAPVTNGVQAAAQPIFNTPSGTTILFDQTANPGTNGAPAQNFSSSYDVYDNESADDFVVPAGGWTVSTVNIASTGTLTFTGPTPAAVNFYPDAGGLPGATPACSFPTATATVTASTTSIALPSGCSLTAGTYWVGISVDFNFVTQGQFFWSTQSSGSGSSAAWRNPGDGFALGCTNWDTFPNCTVAGGIEDALSFQLLGAAGGGGVPAEPPRELPTLSQWSTLLAVGGLALLGLFGVRRRSRI